MKKLCSLAIFFGLGCFLFGQNVGGGLVLGFNASQVDGDAFSGFNRAGLSVGGFVHYKFTDRVALQPEILFEQLGSANSLGVILKTSHISIPVLLNVTLPVQMGSHNQEVQFHVGPVIGLLVKARDFDVDVTQVLNQVDFRAVAGAAFRFTQSLSFGIRYGYSIVSFVETNVPLATALIAPGKGGLAHHYVNLSLRIHLSE